MSNILAISAALKSSSLALRSKNKIFESVFENDTPTFLVSNIDIFLKNNSFLWENLDGVIACSGPGSFTAIRTTISVIKSVKQFLNISVIAINTFELFELKYKKEIDNKNSIIILKSEMLNEVYVKIIEKNGESNIFAIYLDDLIVSENIDVILSDFKCEIGKNYSMFICDLDIKKAKNLLSFSDRLKNLSGTKLSSFYVKPPYVKS